MEKLRKELARWGDEPFFFQKDNYIKFSHRCFHGYADSFMVICEKIQERMQSSLWRMTLPPLGGAKPYRFDDLKDMIGNFDWDILKTVYGRLYEGVIRDDKGVKVQEVTIKTWDFFCPRQRSYAGHPYTFCNELEILTGEDPHPNLMKIKGFCFQEALAVVYDEKPTMFLSMLLLYDTDFRLRGRIKVATQLASLIAWLHEKQFTVRAIDLSDIMIDEDLNIKVFDFIYLAPIREDNKTVYPLIYHVNSDSPEYASGGVQPLKAGVYMFGVLLVELFAKIKKIPTPHYCWIQEQLQGGKKSIVDKSLLQDNDDDDELLANSITTITAKCLERDPDARTGMKNVFDELSKLLDGARRERGTKRKAGS